MIAAGKIGKAVSSQTSYCRNSKDGEWLYYAIDPAWDLSAPRYSPDGRRVAFTASHVGLKHTMPAQLAVWERGASRWDVVSAEWDHETSLAGRRVASTLVTVPALAQPAWKLEIAVVAAAP